MIRVLGDLARLMRAVFVLSRHDALMPHEIARTLPLPVRALRAMLAVGGGGGRGRSPGARLAQALERLGPAYIKLGQVLATRPDIVGDEVAEALKDLQDRLPPFAQDLAVAEVEAELGKPLHEIFREFGPPIAAASIAQVHRAQTAEEPSRDVAVKVFRPGVEAAFARDLSAFALAARMAERLSPEARRLRLTALVETLAQSVALELDLRLEAAAASELAEAMADDPDFRVPDVDWTRTSARVLTTEWIVGTSVRDREALIAAGHDPKAVARIVLATFLDSALRHGFFHADLHQGNLFVDSEHRLVVVDFGIMGRLDAAMRRFMAETLAGFLDRDYLRVAKVHFEAGFVPAQHQLLTFAQALRAIGEPVFGRTARDVSMAKLLQQLFDTTRRFDMALQPQLVLLQKTMVVVEGVARSLDPDFDIWEASRPVMTAFMTEQVGPAARFADLRDTAEALAGTVRELPDMLRNARTAAKLLAGEGVKLHADSLEAFAHAQDRRIAHLRWALWIGAIALLVLAARPFV